MVQMHHSRHPLSSEDERGSHPVSGCSLPAFSITESVKFRKAAGDWGRGGARRFFILFTLFKNFTFPFDALGPRRAPTFWPAESRQRLAEGLRPYRYPLAVALARPAAAIRAPKEAIKSGTAEPAAASRRRASALDLRGLRRKSRFGRGTMRVRAGMARKKRRLHLHREFAIIKTMRDQPLHKSGRLVS